MVPYLKFFGLIAVSTSFLLFGVQVLMAAYKLNDPYAFIMTFFASNFIILISAALILGFVLRIHRLYKGHLPKVEPPGSDEMHVNKNEDAR